MTFGKMFPEYSYYSLSLKLQEINKNIFLNDFFYDVLDTIPLRENKEVLRDYLRLNFIDYEENYDMKKK